MSDSPEEELAWHGGRRRHPRQKDWPYWCCEHCSDDKDDPYCAAKNRHTEPCDEEACVRSDEQAADEQRRSAAIRRIMAEQGPAIRAAAAEQARQNRGGRQQ